MELVINTSPYKHSQPENNIYSQFLRAGIDVGDDIILLRRLVIVNSFLLMVIAIFGVFAVYNFIRGATTTAMLDIVGLCISAFAMWQLQFHQNYTFAINLSSISLFFLLLGLAYISQNENYALVWTVTYPIYVILVKGRVEGVRYSAIYYLVLFSLAYDGIGEWQNGEWNTVSFIRFCCASLVITYSAYFNETALEKAYEELSEMRKREKQLALEKEEMSERVLRHKNQFLADISHELRTPLTALKVQLEMLEDGLSKDPEDTYKTLHNRLDNLNQLVSDLHQLSLSDSGLTTLNLERIDVAILLSDVISSFEPVARAKHIDLNFNVNLTESVYVNADKGRISQVLINIINNSLDYTDAGGELHISYQSNYKEVAIRFEDSAPGVSAEELPKLFDRLYRVEASRNRKTGGSGLGLSICKSLVESHGGKISAGTSTLGGISVCVRLPRIQSPSKNVDASIAKLTESY